MRVGIAGLGRLGGALAEALRRLGHEVAVYSRHLGGEVQALASARVIFITRKDREIPGAVRELKLLPLEGKLVFHCSGATPLDVLEPLRPAKIGVFHPVQSFPEPNPELFKGIAFGFLGDPEARRVAEELAEALGGHLIEVKDQALYHAACTLASGGLVRLLRLAARGFSLASGGSEADLLRLSLTTLLNAQKLGLGVAETGPWVRGDWTTVMAHRRALWRALPEALKLYNLLQGEGGIDLGPLLELLRCPRCGGRLRQEGEALVCEGCGARFPIRDGVPTLEDGESYSFWLSLRPGPGSPSRSRGPCPTGSSFSKTPREE